MKKVVLFKFLFFAVLLSANAQVTYIDIPLAGSINTNDLYNGDVSYGPSATLNTKPDGSIANLILNVDGTFTFSGDVVGRYIYEIPVCILPAGTDCFSYLLKLQIVDFLESDSRPIVINDTGITEKNTTITLNTLGNDRCVVTNGCALDLSSVSIVTSPNQGGIVTVNELNGDISYTPPLDFIGKDTWTYQVCVDGEVSNCVVAEQIITVMSEATTNSTFAIDDFTNTQQSTPVTGNVLNNDFDVEGDVQSVEPQIINIPEGNLTLNVSGDYIFEPAESFFGPVQILYSVCDNNATMQCADASLNILVVKDLSINLRVYLEGALLNNGNEIGTTHKRPLMRDDLRVSSFNSKRYIPDNDPYGNMSVVSWESKKEKYVHETSGLLPKFSVISDPEMVFEVSGEDAITDWVFIELRSKSDYTTIIATRSGLVQRDGDVVDLDGVSGLRFPGVDVDNYYVVVKHRNHFGAMTAEAMTPSQLHNLVDFTMAETGFFSFGSTKFEVYDYTNLAQNPRAKTGYLALWAGDFDGNGKIKYSSPGGDLNVLFSDIIGYKILDDNGNFLDYNFDSSFDHAFGYFNSDFDMNSKSKFDNPNDDKNMIYGNLLFYKMNKQYEFKFDFFIEQIPN